MSEESTLTTQRSSRGMDPDRLAELEDERRFLLRSLADLERERDAGDVDDLDYHELRDGYTVRAAAVLRSIDEGRSSLPAKPPANWTRRLIGVGITVVAVGVVWWALAASSAQRLPGQEITGFDPRDERQVLMAQARSIQFDQPGRAAEIYALVLSEDPDDAEALAYRGWTLALASTQQPDGADVEAQLRESVDLLFEATEVDPDYPDPQCFLAIVQYRFLGQADAAAPFMDRCLEANPPADIRDLIEPLQTEIESATSN